MEPRPCRLPAWQPLTLRPPSCQGCSPHPSPAGVLDAVHRRYYSHFRKDSRLYSYPIAGQSPKLYNLLPHPKGPSVLAPRWMHFTASGGTSCVTSRVDGRRLGCIRGTSRAGSQLGGERGHLGDCPRGRMSGGGGRRCSCELWGRRERGEHSSHPRCKEPRLLQAMSSLMGRPDRTFRDQQVKGSMSQVHHG